MPSLSVQLEIVGGVEAHDLRQRLLLAAAADFLELMR
jgi:hypothetical protein